MVYILICEVLLNGGIMNKKRIIILTVSLIAVVGIIVGVSYAFFSIGGSQEQANTFTSGCLNISLTDASSSISLSNIYPIKEQVMILQLKILVQQVPIIPLILKA